ncbi:hypothetical protein [Azohydromonas lata]|uniref:hypothetical protein n=1 Tax=Azohydromonas lata TaxID=45677 RepID=UPI00082CB2AB|nr:hypothetical protein [Azohydromonas lata]
MKAFTKRRSIATVSLSGTLPENPQAIAAARFDGIELVEPDFSNVHMSATELRSRRENPGLRVELFQPLRDPVAASSSNWCGGLATTAVMEHSMHRLA